MVKIKTITVRLPESLHKAARELAKRENTSLNSLITIALAEKLSALMAEEVLDSRAVRGDRARFDTALAQAADIEPEEYYTLS